MSFCKCNGVCFGFVACWGGDCYVQSRFDEEGVEIGWKLVAGVVNVDVSIVIVAAGYLCCVVSKRFRSSGMKVVRS